MKVKIVSIITVASVLIVAMLVSLTTILVGAKNVSSSFVKLELIPKIEFVCDIHKNVVNFCALNKEGEIVASNINFKGENIEDVIKMFLTECGKLGYINLDENNYNVIKLTVVSGLTQSLDVSVYKTVNKWFANCEVLGVIIENQNDMQMVKSAKQLGISANKLALINSIINLNPTLKVEHLKNICEKDLIDIINDLHKTKNENIGVIEQKEELKQQNEEVFLKHIANINKKNQGKFIQKLRDLNRKVQSKIELNYSNYDK